MVYSIFENMERCTPVEVQRLLPLVPEEHQAIALKFKHTFGQFATLESILMLKELLVSNGLVPEDDSLHFEYTPHGKPYLVNHQNVHFNISHCPNAIAVAVDSVPIGVDVERFVTPSESLLNYCLNEDEVQQVKQSACPERTFAAFWTKKEALFKLRGTGITHELRNVLTLLQPNERLETTLFEEKKYAFTLALTIH